MSYLATPDSQRITTSPDVHFIPRGTLEGAEAKGLIRRAGGAIGILVISMPRINNHIRDCLCSNGVIRVRAGI